ncbi:MAG: hypothetical protein SOY52_06815 [Bullifex sp.]|nr:hypothetical protein [Bullifex sp.]
MRLSNLEKTQPYMASRISEELENNKVPQSIMFLGPKFSSRMTGAIELGLNLLNESNHFQDLDVSDLIILSSRNFALRLKALRNLFSASRNKRSWDLLLRETRIMLLSCHPALSNSSDKDLFKAAAELSDVLLTYQDDMDDKTFDKFLSSYDKALASFFSSSKKKSGFTIDQIRDVQAFLQLESERGKVVIFENIEDVTVGAMNSLLKLLEEPMPGAHLILISQDQSRILDTILSRVRKYEFNEIDSNLTSNFVINTFFKQADSSLEEFFYVQAGFDNNQLIKIVNSFFEKAFVKREKDSYDNLNTINAFLDEFDTYPLFVKYLYEKFEKKALLDRDVRAMKALKSLSNIFNDSTIYNQNKKIMIDRIERSLRNE